MYNITPVKKQGYTMCNNVIVNQSRQKYFKTTVLSVQYISLKIVGRHSTTENIKEINMATMYNFRHGLFVHIIKSSKQ
jgi:hypothetical protein